MPDGEYATKRLAGTDSIWLSHDRRAFAYESIFALLCVYAVAAQAAPLLLPIREDIARILEWGDTAVCLIFLLECGYHLARAEHKLAHLKWGWIDILSSIPTLDIARWGRLMRLARAIRAMQAAHASWKLTAWVVEDAGTVD
jgi:voltage-gated potassium channel